MGAIARLDNLVDALRLSNAASRLNAVLAYNNAQEACVVLLRRDDISVEASSDSVGMTKSILQRLFAVENPNSQTGFSYIDTVEIAVDTAFEQGFAWSVARYLDALSAELEGIERA